MFSDTGALSPTARKAVYSIAGVLAVVLTFFTIAPDFNLDAWVEVVVQVLGAVGLVLAAIKTKRVDYTAFYGAGAAIVAALTVLGVVHDGADSQLYDLMAQISLAIPALTAVFRTNTTVPTGQPEAEFVAEQVGVVPAAAEKPYDPQHVVDERGAANVQWLYIAAAVVVIIVGIVLLFRLL